LPLTYWAPLFVPPVALVFALPPAPPHPATASAVAVAAAAAAAVRTLLNSCLRRGSGPDGVG
jgi:hypothetical protein